MSGNNKHACCTYCGLLGHTVDRCYKIYGYPLGYKPKYKNNPSANQLSTITLDLKMDRSSNGGDFHVEFENQCNVSEAIHRSFTMDQYNKIFSII